MIPTYLMSYPRPDWGLRGKQNFLSASGGAAPSPRGAMRDWLAVASAIETAGGRVLVMPPSPCRNLTGMPYTAEAGEFYRDSAGRPCFLLSRMAAAHRAPEPEYTAGFVQALGWHATSPEAVWEAQGDAIRVGPFSIVHTYGVGPAARTAKAAYDEVAAHLSARHMQLAFRADPWFHGNTFLAWFHRGNDHVILVCDDVLEADARDQLAAFAPHATLVDIDVAASRNYATNALQVCDTVLAPTGLPDAILGLWRELGLEVVELALPTLFRRGGGAAVCMTSRLWGLAEGELPDHLTFAACGPALTELAETYPETP